MQTVLTRKGRFLLWRGGLLRLKTKLESQPIERFGIERLAAAEGQLKYYTGLASYLLVWQGFGHQLQSLRVKLTGLKGCHGEKNGYQGSAMFSATIDKKNDGEGRLR